MHGHYLHVCNEVCKAVRSAQRYTPGKRQDSITPDFSIRIERTGGGAAPVGYIALSGDDNGEILAEEWTEAKCYHQLLGYLFDGEYHPSFQCNTLPTFEFQDRISTRIILGSFSHFEPWKNAALLHDISDVCLAIDSFGMMS